MSATQAIATNEALDAILEVRAMMAATGHDRLAIEEDAGECLIVLGTGADGSTHCATVFADGEIEWLR